MIAGDKALVGRDLELGILRAALASALAGNPRIALCSGEAGVGKTRLLTELAREAQQQSVPVWWARSLELGDAPPYWLWRQIVDLDGRAADSDPADRAALFTEIVDWLGKTSEAAGGVLVVDDIQWADEPSLIALLHVVRSLRGQRLLICLAERMAPASPGWLAVKPRLHAEAAVETIALQGLSIDDTATYLEMLVEGRVSATVARQIREFTGGNPFFIRELGRTVPQHSRADQVVVPPRLVDVVADRIAGLSADAQQLLRAASILGENFGLAIAARLVLLQSVEILPAVDEAIKAGLLAFDSAPGQVRFSHAIVRAALAAGLSLHERVQLHMRAAAAIEELHADALDSHLAELARHWAEVAVTGDHVPAALWCRRAADHAMTALAFEESERLYRMALDHSAPDTEPYGRLLLAVATAASRAGRWDAAGEACADAVRIANRLDDAELLADAALALTPAGEPVWDRDIRDRCAEALRRLAPGHPALRARLLARRVEALVYCGEYGDVLGISSAALHQADESGDVDAVVAALSARQLACSAPEYVDEREQLAARTIEMGSAMGKPAVEMWGRLWAADVGWQHGRLDEVAREVRALAWCAERAGGPIARWHVLVAQAAVAQARAEFETAIQLATAAFELLAPLGHPAATGAYLALRAAVGHHIGHRESELPEVPPELAGAARNELFKLIGLAFVLAESGRIAEAEQLYRRSGAPETWTVPPYFSIDAMAVGAQIAIAIGDVDNIGYFRERLGRWRGWHVVNSAGSGNYFGPVELVLGKCAAAVGRWDEADVDLATAERICLEIGAPGFAVEAEAERAVLAVRRGDEATARTYAESALRRAEVLGMTPWVTTLRAVLDVALPDEGLSPREREVAELVAGGKSNREIAQALVISERTAQNHVQHILVKLSFANRSQIPAWVARKYPDE